MCWVFIFKEFKIQWFKNSRFRGSQGSRFQGFLVSGYLGFKILISKNPETSEIWILTILKSCNLHAKKPWFLETLDLIPKTLTP
jgi:hypothetical protein